jgi:alpha-beta hydrolase superfamily lysophospholipase
MHRRSFLTAAMAAVAVTATAQTIAADEEDDVLSRKVETGHVEVNGLNMYYESHGSGGVPVIFTEFVYSPTVDPTAARAQVPTLILHPVDDRIVKVEEARKLAAAAAGNELVHVWELPAGKHGILEAIDRRWTFAVYRAFFERWGRYAERERGAGAAMVYSPRPHG